jgi:biopolymer transport protein ExbD
MAIYKPGERHRYHNILKRRKGKRGVIAVLSLTAMVDMFTVLVIFLLQNFSSEQQMLDLHRDIKLPEAHSTKDLKPAFVVVVTSKEILLDKQVIATYDEVKGQKDWMIQKLFDLMKTGLAKAKEDNDAQLSKQIRDVVDQATKKTPEDPNAWNKVTVEADKTVDILTVKKVMYTVTEAGAGEINFAVTKKPKDSSTN